MDVDLRRALRESAWASNHSPTGVVRHDSSGVNVDVLIGMVLKSHDEATSGDCAVGDNKKIYAR